MRKKNRHLIDRRIAISGIILIMIINGFTVWKLAHKKPDDELTRIIEVTEFMHLPSNTSYRSEFTLKCIAGYDVDSGNDDYQKVMDICKKESDQLYGQMIPVKITQTRFDINSNWVEESREVLWKERTGL